MSTTFILSKVKNILPAHIKLIIYNSLFRSHLEYCCVAWGGVSNKLISSLQILQKRALRYVANTKANSHVNPLFLKYKQLNVKDMINSNLGIFMYHYNNSLLPNSFEDFFEKLQNHERHFCFKTNLIRSKSLTSFPSNMLPKFWNSLDLKIKRCSSLNSFKNNLMQHFHSKNYIMCKDKNCYSCT